MKSIKLIKYSKNFSLAEIFQSLDIKFAFVNDKYEQITSPAKCRDFLGDCIWSYKTKTKASIYNFNYNFKETPYDLKKLRLSLKFPDSDSKEFFLKNFHTITELETQYKIPKSKILETDEKDTLIVEANKVWQSASWKISLYTYFLKVASYEDKSKLQDPENKYNATLTDEKLTLLMNKIKIKKDVVPESINNQHNNTGFISILTGYANIELKKLLGVI